MEDLTQEIVSFETSKESKSAFESQDNESEVLWTNSIQQYSYNQAVHSEAVTLDCMVDIDTLEIVKISESTLKSQDNESEICRGK